MTGHPAWRLFGSVVASGRRLKKRSASPFLGFTASENPKGLYGSQRTISINFDSTIFLEFTSYSPLSTFRQGVIFNMWSSMMWKLLL
jgi:hypothetical protein